MRALPVVSVVLSVLLAAQLVACWARRALARSRAPWRVAESAAPRNPAGVATVVDIAPYLARRELVEGAIAVAALSRRESMVRHSERLHRLMPSPVVDIASRRPAAVGPLPGVPGDAAASRRSGITVARSTRLTSSDTIEHLA